MQPKIYTVNELEEHIPTFSVKAILDVAGTYDLWKFADLYCSRKNFEMIAPLIMAYSSQKIQNKK